MLFINETNNLISQWSKTTDSKFCLVQTNFDHADFVTLISLFLKFKEDHKDSALKKLCITSFSSIDYKILNTAKTINNSSTNKVTNCITSLFASPVTGCHRLLFEDGCIQLDLWLGEFIKQFNSAFNPASKYQHQRIVDNWMIDGSAISTWSINQIDSFCKIVGNTSKSNSKLAIETSSTLLKQKISDNGYILDKVVSNKAAYFSFDENKLQRPKGITSEKIKDVAIIGGGIASLCTALSLAKRGQNVTLYCSEENLGVGASGNLQGALYPLINEKHDELSQLFTNAYLFALNFYKSIHNKHPFSHQFNGLIQLGYDSTATKKLLKIKKANLPHEITHWVKTEELDKLAGINVNLEGLHYPNGGWLSPRELIHSLHKQLLSYHNVKILLAHRIETITNLLPEKQIETEIAESTQFRWQLSKKNIAGVTHCNTNFTHQAVIIAAGMDTLNFQQCRAIPLSAARGQVSHIESNSTLSSLKRTLCHEGYLTPSLNGLHCMGATFKRHDLDTNYRDHDQVENHQKLKKCIQNQDWVDAITTNTEAHVGIRSTTRDHFPYVGPLSNYDEIKSNYELNQKAEQEYPELPNIYLLTGLGSRGLCTAPLLAEVIASQINNEPLPISEQIYRKMEIPRQWRNYIRKNKPLKE